MIYSKMERKLLMSSSFRTTLPVHLLFTKLTK